MSFDGRVSLCQLVAVQYRGYEYGILSLTRKFSQLFLISGKFRVSPHLRGPIVKEAKN